MTERKLTFLGTGEAFDPNRRNTSYLIETPETSIMVDCGYTAPMGLLKVLQSRQEGEAALHTAPEHLLITHLHGDHIGGINSLLVPMWENGRTRLLHVYSPPDREKVLDELMKLEYINLAQTLKQTIPLRHHTWGKEQQIGDMVVRTAHTQHSVTNYALRFDYDDGESFAISGDGGLTEESKKLFESVNFLIHEGFTVRGESNNVHASMEDVVNFCADVGIQDVYIVHMNRHERKKEEEIKGLVHQAYDSQMHVSLPHDLDVIRL